MNNRSNRTVNSKIIPKVLYKYRNWNDPYHRKILEENEIFFPSAQKFNDPFDSTFRFRFKSNKDLYDSFCKFDPSMNCRKKAELKDKLKNNPNLYKQLLEQYPMQDFCNHGIFTLSETKDNIIMWSHYSDSHQGFCVGFDIQKLKEYIDLKGYPNDRNMIKYKKNYPFFNPLDQNNSEEIIRLLYIKSKNWKYEKEYRIILGNKKNEVIKIGDNIIVEVILGYSISPNHREEIIHTLKSKNQKIKLYQAVLDENKFGLKFQKLEY